MSRLYDNNILCQTKWLKYLCTKSLVCYASLIVLIHDNSLKKYAGESLNSIGQWDWNLQITLPNWIKLRLANHNLKKSPVSGPICSHWGPVVMLVKHEILKVVTQIIQLHSPIYFNNLMSLNLTRSIFSVSGKCWTSYLLQQVVNATASYTRGGGQSQIIFTNLEDSILWQIPVTGR